MHFGRIGQKTGFNLEFLESVGYTLKLCVICIDSWAANLFIDFCIWSAVWCIF